MQGSEVTELSWWEQRLPEIVANLKKMDRETGYCLVVSDCAALIYTAEEAYQLAVGGGGMLQESTKSLIKEFRKHLLREIDKVREEYDLPDDLLHQMYKQ